MTRSEYIDNILKNYSLISKLSDKNDCLVLRIRNKKLNKDLVLRSFAAKIEAYSELYKIKCENLPLIYDVIDLSDGQIVLEEFIDGLTIDQVLQSGKYSYHGAKKVIYSVCCGLYAMHKGGLVHRDIKPENIIIDNNGRVVLIDFNVSRRQSLNTKDTVVMGTVGYAAPEQLGISQSDARTDIYAVGVLLNVMLTGEHPSKKLASGKAKNIIKKCTLLNTNERYQTVQKLINAL